MQRPLASARSLASDGVAALRWLIPCVKQRTIQAVTIRNVLDPHHQFEFKGELILSHLISMDVSEEAHRGKLNDSLRINLESLVTT